MDPIELDWMELDQMELDWIGLVQFRSFQTCLDQVAAASGEVLKSNH